MAWELLKLSSLVRVIRQFEVFANSDFVGIRTALADLGVATTPMQPFKDIEEVKSLIEAFNHSDVYEFAMDVKAAADVARIARNKLADVSYAVYEFTVREFNKADAAADAEAKTRTKANVEAAVQAYANAKAEKEAAAAAEAAARAVMLAFVKAKAE